MIRKKLPYDTMLAIALMMSVLRVDWTDYLRDDAFVTHSRWHDSLIGPSVGLTETQFHNLYNSGVDLGHLNSKNVIGDSFYYNRSVFRELGSLYNGDGRPSRLELQTFMLDTLESGSGHRTSTNNNRQVMVPQAEQHPAQSHLNVNHHMHESDSDEGFGEMETELEGAVGQSSLSVSPAPSDELSVEDMDLIESLWRQDIDMGVCPDTYPYKGDITKPGFNDELKKNINLWEYSIDGETGEFVPGPLPEESVQPAVQPQVAQTQQPPQQQPEPQESSLSLEDCLQLLEDEYSPDMTQTDLSPVLSHHEVEQRWQDLATIPELQGSIPELMPSDASLNSTQGAYVDQQQHYIQAMANGSSGLTPEVVDLPPQQRLNDVFAVNATTNGMVSLQNATQSHQLMQNDTFSHFTNLTSPSHTATNTTAASNDNMTEFLMQTLQQQMSAVNASAAYSAGNLNVPENSSSLLMELLNSPGAAHPVNPLDIGFDDQMQDVLTVLGDDGESLEDEDSDGSIFDDSEGAAGYSSSSDQDVFKGATGGYGFARGHERQYGSDSSSNSYSGQPPKMENIKHNHSYAAPSESQMQNGNGAQNNSFNVTNSNAFKFSRDEKRAKSLKLPITVEKIINLPVDAFNDAIKTYELNDAQMQLIRDIRRRGKNKVAAQNCRKRKIDAITVVESTVGELRMERDKLVKERDSIDKEVTEMQLRYAELCEEVFSSIQDEHGSPVDPNDYTLQQMPDGTVFLVPRNGNSSSHRDRDNQSM